MNILEGNISPDSCAQGQVTSVIHKPITLHFLVDYDLLVGDDFLMFALISRINYTTTCVFP